MSSLIHLSFFFPHAGFEQKEGAQSPKYACDLENVCVWWPVVSELGKEKLVSGCNISQGGKWLRFQEWGNDEAKYEFF